MFRSRYIIVCCMFLEMSLLVSSYYQQIPRYYSDEYTHSIFKKAEKAKQFLSAEEQFRQEMFYENEKKMETIEGCGRDEREINLIKRELNIKMNKMRGGKCQYKQLDNCRY